MTRMILIITNPTNHTLLYAFWLNADQTQSFPYMKFSFLALRIFKGLWWCRIHQMGLQKISKLFHKTLIPFLIKSILTNAPMILMKKYDKQNQGQIAFAQFYSIITYQEYNKLMNQTNTELSIPDNKSDKIGVSDQFSLPLIKHKPASRGSIQSKKNPIKTQDIILPNINDDDQSVQIDNQTENKSQAPSQVENNQQKPEIMTKSKFALDVEEKLKLVLGGMQGEPTVEEGDSVDSDDFDFEAKINANKELIKMNRMKKQNQNQSSEAYNKLLSSNPPKPKKSNRPKVESLYEKRIREYKDQSIQNKYLQKKKQSVKQKPINPVHQVRQSLRQIKPKQYVSTKQNVKKQSFSTKKVYPRVPSQKSLKQQQNDKKVNKSINLFDGIQNYLQNPRQNKQSIKNNGQKPLIGLSLLKAKRDIEDKIKSINEKLGLSKQQQKIFGITCIADGGKDKIANETVRNWRKLEIRERKINLLESNFDKELERISSLQQHNSHSLQKYLQHQKILLQLELRKKGLGPEANTQ